MLKRSVFRFVIYTCFAFFYCNGINAKSVTEHVDHDEVNKLPEVSIEHYKKELLEFQRLQRDNEKLKLEEKNITMHNHLQSLGVSGVESTKIVSIYTSRRGKGGLVAQVYNRSEGIREVKVGSYIMNHYKVVKITPESVSLYNTKRPLDGQTIQLTLVALGAYVTP